MKPLLDIKNVSKAYKRKRALDDISLQVGADTLTVLCGPPQSGKSVLLRLLVGLEQADSGEIWLDGKSLAGVPAGQRRIGYVPQSFALYPHMSVFENIAYPLRLHRVARQAVQERVHKVAELLEITPLLRKTPDQLSGGEKQRTAVARGLLNDAELFILDDPLVGLDFKLRERLMEDLRDMRRTLGIAFVYATSDPLEALMMADQLAVIDGGRVVEHRKVEDLYMEPRWLRSAELIGFPRCNLMEASYQPDRQACRSALFDFEVDAEGDWGSSRQAALALRPEDIAVAGAGVNDDSAASLQAEGRVRLVEDLGAECIVYFEAGEVSLATTLRIGEAPVPQEGHVIQFSVRPERMIVFDAETGRRIGRGRGLNNG